MHADDQRLNGGGLFGAVDYGMKPGELGGIELVGAGVIHGDEIDIAIDPVIVRPQFMILRIVLQALCAQRRCIEPVGKLYEVLFARGGRDGLVIPGAQQDGECAKGI